MMDDPAAIAAANKAKRSVAEQGAFDWVHETAERYRAAAMTRKFAALNAAPPSEDMGDVQDVTVRTSKSQREAAKKFKLPPGDGRNRHVRRQFQAMVRKAARTVNT
jgi:hypothetical protein